MPFDDWFGARAEQYAARRPGYPDALFAYLASIAPRGRVWDCACGNGQASMGLAQHFGDIVATDLSERQIASAPDVGGASFRVASAEDSGLETGSCGLVTAAQALHWFAGPAFYAEATRVLQPGGVIAAWSYSLCRVTEEVDVVVRHLFHDVLGSYWPAERRHVDDGYADFVLPGRSLAVPGFAMQARWSADDMLGYLGTWSAVGRCRDATGTDPLASIGESLRAAWPSGQALVDWPLVVLAAQKV